MSSRDESEPPKDKPKRPRQLPFDPYGLLDMFSDKDSRFSLLARDIVLYAIMPCLRMSPGYATPSTVHPHRTKIDHFNLDWLEPELSPHPHAPSFEKRWLFAFLATGDPMFIAPNHGVLAFVWHYGTFLQHNSPLYKLSAEASECLAWKRILRLYGVVVDGHMVCIIVDHGTLRVRLQTLATGESTAEYVSFTKAPDDASGGGNYTCTDDKQLPDGTEFGKLIAEHTNVAEFFATSLHSIDITTVNDKRSVAFLQRAANGSNTCGIYDWDARRVISFADITAHVCRSDALDYSAIWDDADGNICLRLSVPTSGVYRVSITVPVPGARFVWLYRDTLRVMKELSIDTAYPSNRYEVDYRGRLCYIFGTHLLCLS